MKVRSERYGVVIVQLDEMQFGFRPGRGTTDAIFIVRQLQEKYLLGKEERVVDGIPGFRKSL